MKHSNRSLALGALFLIGILFLVASELLTPAPPAAADVSVPASAGPKAALPSRGEEALHASGLAERSQVPPFTPTSHARVGGRVVFLSLARERAEPYQGRLVATRSADPKSPLETSSGALELPVGHWHIESESARLSQTELEVSQGSQTVVWAWQPFNQVVRVMSADHLAPIEGARVVWKASKSPESYDLLTDSLGAARFAGSQALGNPSGRFKVWAPGYTMSTIRQEARPEGPELVVLLDPLPEDAAPLGVLQLIDLASGQPLAGVRALQEPRRPEALSDASGRLPLSAALTPHSRVELSLSGYMTRRPYVSDALEAGGRVPMAPAVPVRVMPHLQSAGHLYVTSIQEPGGAELHAFPGWRFGPAVPFGEGEDVELELPEGVWVRLEAVGEHAERASVDWQVVANAGVVQLEPDASSEGEVLVLDVMGPDGARLATPEARVYDRRLGDLTLAPESSGTFRITRAETVESIWIFSHGTPRVSLSQVHLDGEVGASAGGRLVVTAPETFDVPVTLVDSTGTPIVGLHVALTSDDGLANAQKYPHLDGGLPTDHPRWALDQSPDPTGTSDDEGRVVLQGVQPGALRLTPDLPAERGGSWLTPYRPRSIDVTIASAAPLEVTLPRPKLVRFTVVDGTTHEPLSVASLTDLGLPYGKSFEGSATPWTGWVSATGGPFEISAPGYQPLEVSGLELAGEPELMLSARPPARVRLVGPDELLRDLEGRALQVNHLAEPVPGTGGMRPTTRRSSPVVQAGCLLIDLSPGDTFRVPPVRTGTRRISFEPATLTWQGEDELKLQIHE